MQNIGSFSLDVEGAEFQILKTIPLQEVDIKVIDVEVNHVGEIFPGTWEEILDYLDTQGYEFHSKISFKGISFLDAIFVKKGFLDKLNDKPCPSKSRSKRKSKKPKITEPQVKDSPVCLSSHCDFPKKPLLYDQS